MSHVIDPFFRGYAIPMVILALDEPAAVELHRVEVLPSCDAGVVSRLIAFTKSVSEVFNVICGRRNGVSAFHQLTQ